MFCPALPKRSRSQCFWSGTGSLVLPRRRRFDFWNSIFSAIIKLPMKRSRRRSRCSARPPLAEMETARRMARLVHPWDEVRRNGCDHRRPGAVWKSYPPGVWRGGNSYFIDEQHSVLMNPFVEYLRSAIEMIVQNFSYESVFRYLRCGCPALQERRRISLRTIIACTGNPGAMSAIKKAGCASTGGAQSGGAAKP